MVAILRRQVEKDRCAVLEDENHLVTAMMIDQAVLVVALTDTKREAFLDLFQVQALRAAAGVEKKLFFRVLLLRYETYIIDHSVPAFRFCIRSRNQKEIR